MTRKIILFCFVLSLIPIVKISAHPMPNSVVLLNIHSSTVTVELQLPLNELQLAVPFDVIHNTETLVQRSGLDLSKYIIEHTRAESVDHQKWSTKVVKLFVKPMEQSTTGLYQELVVLLTLQAPEGKSTKNFILNYDVIIHQLVTHTALVKIQQDWDNGINEEHPVEVGVVSVDVPTNTVPPLTINQKNGSIWKGFENMVLLGIRHISEGTDHLLFLLVLLQKRNGLSPVV
jgi:hypothetical protein